MRGRLHGEGIMWYEGFRGRGAVQMLSSMEEVRQVANNAIASTRIIHDLVFVAKYERAWKNNQLHTHRPQHRKTYASSASSRLLEYYRMIIWKWLSLKLLKRYQVAGSRMLDWLFYIFGCGTTTPPQTSHAKPDWAVFSTQPWNNPAISAYVHPQKHKTPPPSQRILKNLRWSWR